MSDLATRYGAPSRARRTLVVVGLALLAAAALAWLAWVVLFHGRPEVRSNLEGFSLSGQHQARATYVVVRRDAGVRATCVLRAYAEDHSVVGQAAVRVPSAGGDVQDLQGTVRTSFRTERRANAVDLVGCVAPGQGQPR